MSILRKRLTYWLALALVLSLVINFSRDIIRLLKNRERIDQAKEKLQKTETEHQQLKMQKNSFQTEEFIEREARNKLFMGKEGEVVVLLPEELKALEEEKLEVEEKELSIWRQWLELFW